MTASTSVTRPDQALAPTSLGVLPGFGGLVRKELTEWRRGRRAWIVLIVATLFMTLTAVNSWLVAILAPTEGGEPLPEPILDPMANLVAAVSTQIFVVIAIFAVMSLIVSERESGTLAWTASKPVSRAAIWLAKWVSSTAMLGLLAGLAPLVATVVLVVVVYGGLPILPVLIMAVGIVMAIALFVAIGLAIGDRGHEPGGGGRDRPGRPVPAAAHRGAAADRRVPANLDRRVGARRRERPGGRLRDPTELGPVGGGADRVLAAAHGSDGALSLASGTRDRIESSWASIRRPSSGRVPARSARGAKGDGVLWMMCRS